jgi:hypothetical protein
MKITKSEKAGKFNRLQNSREIGEANLNSKRCETRNETWKKNGGVWMATLIRFETNTKKKTEWTPALGHK